MLVDQTFSIRLAKTRYFVTLPGFFEEGFDFVGEMLVAVLLIVNISSKRFDACSSGVNGGTFFFFFLFLLLLLFRILSGGGDRTDSEENPRGVTICLHIFSLNILFAMRLVSYVILWFSLFVLLGTDGRLSLIHI